MNTKLISFFAAGIFAGCANPSSTPHVGAEVKPGLIMIPADQVGYYRSDPATRPEPPEGISALDVDSVQTDSTVTAIQFNRYADPGRPAELMHEAHVVYRRDSGPRWKLQPRTANQQILIGPQLTDGRGEIRSLVAPELDSFLQEQRTIRQREQTVLENVTANMAQIARQQHQLAEQFAKLTPPMVDAQASAASPHPLSRAATPDVDPLMSSSDDSR